MGETNLKRVYDGRMEDQIQEAGAKESFRANRMRRWQNWARQNGKGTVDEECGAP